jgi:hypothetical protein
MPPLPHAYQGRNAIGAFLRGAEERRGAPMRLVATRANTQPAFGCYLSLPDSDVARAFSGLSDERWIWLGLTEGDDHGGASGVDRSGRDDRAYDRRFD